ncbi:nucleophile aminohydrolase [Ochromonadaceae sp. CCMP2298]|nr:nucleophile aminohydrolase [Ochromonadaceae sp. CCMP2298]
MASAFASFLVLLLLCLSASASVHGGTYLAMSGKDSVVLVSDSRFSSQGSGATLLGTHPRFTLRVGASALVGCFGLDADARTLLHLLRRMLGASGVGELEPASVARVVSDLLYSNNLLLSPIVAGLDQGRPYLCTMDGLGAQTVSSTFAVVGTANEGLLSLCESLYTPDLDTEQLIALAERCFCLAMQRDVLSGGDFRVVTLTREAVWVKDVQRLDV